VNCDRPNLHESKAAFCSLDTGDLAAALVGADVFVGVSQPGLLTPEMIQSMNTDPIVFAMANPIPEITPELAAKAGVAVMATGRSDYPNQINNVLVFPGVFRGLLDSGATKVTNEMKLAAAEALAGLVAHPTATEVIPNPFEPGVSKVVAAAVASLSSS